MGITGNLRTMALSDLLQWLSLGIKTGTLLIESRNVEKRIYFQRGRIASSSSSDEREYLGHFLVSHGYITEEELRTAMEVQEESSIFLGKILVMINAISEEDLLRLLRMKAEESIYDIFLWEEGNFEFIDGELPEMRMIHLSLDVTGIIMEGLRRFDEWKRIRVAIKNSQAIPAIVRPLHLETMTDQEKLIVPYINGERAIEEIALQTHNSEFTVSRMIFEGLSLGTMELIEHIGRLVESPYPVAGEEEPGIDEIERMIRRGRLLLADHPDKAWRTLRAAAELDLNDPRPRAALAEAEKQLAQALKRDGIDMKNVPVLKLDLSELTGRNFSPTEGFVLSRINGVWDVKSIVRISPMREMEALLIFQKLNRDGVISWKKIGRATAGI
jgi:Domain of unknown function (DUF4388)